MSEDTPSIPSGNTRTPKSEDLASTNKAARGPVIEGNTIIFPEAPCGQAQADFGDNNRDLKLFFDDKVCTVRNKDNTQPSKERMEKILG